MSKENRLKWIDICKGILMSTIVLMHIDFSFWSNNYIGKYIYDFTSLYKVSLFFCVSGLTLKEEKINQTFTFIKSKAISLYKRIVIWGCLAVLLHNVLIRYGFFKTSIMYSGKEIYIYTLKDILKQICMTFMMANREPIIGPLWFANVLFISFMIIVLLQYFLRRCIKDCRKCRNARFICLLILLIISSILTNKFQFTIPRFNNSLTAAFIIDFSMLLSNEFKLFNTNSKLLFISALLLFSDIAQYGYFSLNSNHFESPEFLIITVLCGIIVISQLSKKILNVKYISSILELIGKNSFWIMALHFFAFKITTCVLNVFGMKLNVYSLTPVANNLGILIIYLFCGLFIPCIIKEIYIKIKLIFI